MTHKRLESLDILRGMDLFLLTALGPLMLLLAKTGEYGWEEAVMPQFHHCLWKGFRLWDLIMPLFMFMSGVTIPFSLEKYREAGHRKSEVYLRIARRFLLLWILGMVAQGHLLDLEWSHLRFFSNTLQAIAVGYLFSALIYLNFKPRWQIVWTALLLLGYWAVMMLFGSGDFNPHGNLCETIDNAVLGAHRDQASIAADGTVVVDPQYTYTWILSSLGFIATVLTGTLAGEILKTGKHSQRKRALILLLAGAGMLLAGYLWGMQMPIVKRIWTSTMVLVSSGWSCIALAAVYYIVDCKGWAKWLGWFKIWGMNSILAYMIHQVLRFTSVSSALLHGFEHLVSPAWYNLIIAFGCTLIEYAILRICYKRKIFLKV